MRDTLDGRNSIACAVLPRQPLKRYVVIPLVILVLNSTGCGGKQPKHPGAMTPIAGCWKGRQIARLDRPSSEWMLFAWKPDSSIVQPLVFETGPRSRIWIADEDVTLERGTVRWGDQEGTLSKDNDSMRVTRGSGVEETSWQFVRDKSADSLMTQLHADIAKPYLYEMPEIRNDGWQCADLMAREKDQNQQYAHDDARV